MADPVIIQLIADYGVGDPAFAEVIQKFTYLDRHIRVNPINVPPFSTIATGMAIAQFATVNAYPGLTVFSNTAPRKTLKGFEDTADGGKLVYTKLEDGAAVVAVNSGYALSFIKNNIKALNFVNVPNVGSQFRSRDYYPDAVIAIAKGDMRLVGEKLDVRSIPEPPEDRIGFIDGYGNLKTTTRHSQCTIGPGTRVRINVNDVTHQGVIADETYKVKDGEISWAPGSTGGTDRFMEIWVRGGSAWESFSKPKVESSFRVTAFDSASK